MKILARLLIIFVLFSISSQIAYAQLTILPYTDKNTEACLRELDGWELMGKAVFEGSCHTTEEGEQICAEGMDINMLMACGIKTGRINLSMIPYFVTYIANFLLALIGIVAVLFIVLGGYWYIYGGLSDDKEKGKKTIINALWGMAVATLSWVLISMIIAAITS
jgi:hypothetical protein